MKLKNIALIGCLSLALPLFAYADEDNIVINNQTNQVGTASAGTSSCSSAAGEQGLLQPGQTKSVPKTFLWWVCPSSANCEAHVYMSKSCDLPEIATATISKDRHVIAAVSKDPRFTVSFDANSFTISGQAKAKKWYDFLFNFAG